MISNPTDELPTEEQFREFAKEKILDTQLVDNTCSVLRCIQETYTMHAYDIVLVNDEDTEKVEIHKCFSDECKRPHFGVMTRVPEDLHS